MVFTGLVRMTQLHQQAFCAFSMSVHHTGEWSGDALEVHGLSMAGKTSALQRDGVVLALLSQKLTMPLD